MSQLGTVYATKRRRRNGKSLKPPPKDGVTKSNPSKRHRERLNAELDLLASLLPFEQNILSKLDRLSILRLSVSYLRTKSYFQVVMHKDKEENGGNAILPHIHAHDGYRTRELGAFEHGLLDGDMFLQALNGFLMILTCDGEVFFATHSIESYLGFHQLNTEMGDAISTSLFCMVARATNRLSVPPIPSHTFLSGTKKVPLAFDVEIIFKTSKSDIVHQSVYELVHSEDREELQRQLLWNSFLPADMSSMQLAETLSPDKALYLERSFTVRFRCLLDNTSGFLRLDIRGRIKVLHGQNRKTEEPPLALFAYCTPFGPPSLLEIPHKENMFKSKHKLDFSLVSMDQRGKHILGYSDVELVNMGGYDLVHYDDLAYVASAHQELLKTGASGMIAYRYQKKDGEWQWLQTSSRLVYKNSKPDFVICTHRVLMDEEGFDLLGKRTMDFKVSYLDTGLASTYFSEADQLVVPPSGSPNSLPPPVTPTRPNRRYKTQLRDFLSTCRSKRKMQQQNQQASPLGQVNSPTPVVEYLPDPAAAVAAAYSNLNPMYTASPYATAADNIYMGTSVHSTNFYPVTENLFHQYRLQGVGGYYADYHHSAAPASAYVAANGFLSYDGYAITSKEEKWQDTGKYYSGYSSGYGSPTSTPQQIPLKTPKSSPHVMEVVSCSSDGPSPVGAGGAIINHTSSAIGNGASVVTPKVEHTPQDPYERQTVLMWGTQSSGIPINSIHPGSSRIHSNSNNERSPQSTPLSNGLSHSYGNEGETSAKWNGSAKDVKSASTPDSYQMHHDDSGLYSASSHTTSPQHRLSSSGSSSGGGGGSGGGSTLSHNTVAESLSSATKSAHHNANHQNAQPTTPTAAGAASATPATETNTMLSSSHSMHSAAAHNTHHQNHTVNHHQTSPQHPHHHHHSHHPSSHHSAHAHHSHTHHSHVTAISPHHHHHHHGTQHHHHHHHPSHAAASPHHPHTHTHPHHHHHHAPPPTAPPHSSSTSATSSSTTAQLSTTPGSGAAAAAAASNGSELMLSQQQQQQSQQHIVQLSPYSQHIQQPLVSLSSAGVETLGNCHNAGITTVAAASASSSPSCTSPTHIQTQQLPAISSVINGLNGGTATAIHHNGTTVTGGGVTVATTPYHQLAIIASPIVITSTTLDNSNDMVGAQGMSLQSLHSGSVNTGRVTTSLGSLGGICPSSYKARNATVMHPSALAYATNAYVIGAGPGAATSCATASLGGLDQNIDGSPLLSFSEVTNTLLNQ